MRTISVMGVGRAGGALALALSQAGFTIDYLIVRDASNAKRIAVKANIISSDSIPEITSDVVLIATGDPDIAIAAQMLAGHLTSQSVVLHTSGSLSSDVLSGLAVAGCSTGSLHPLVSISDALTGSGNFRGAFFCIEGDENAVSTAGSLVKSLGGHPFSIATEFKPLYHAAAVMACGHLVALIDIAAEMLSRCGVERGGAQEILMPLIRSTLANLESRSPSAALTGTFARADVNAFQRHLQAIDEQMSDEVREIYLLLAERSTDLAAAAGVDVAAIGAMRQRIRVAKRKSGC